MHSSPLLTVLLGLFVFVFVLACWPLGYFSTPPPIGYLLSPARSQGGPSPTILTPFFAMPFSRIYLWHTPPISVTSNPRTSCFSTPLFPLSFIHAFTLLPASFCSLVGLVQAYPGPGRPLSNTVSPASQGPPRTPLSFFLSVHRPVCWSHRRAPTFPVCRTPPPQVGTHPSSVATPSRCEFFFIS